ncbi:Eco57I restriction-modification methylase domain-containing protein [Helicobacter canis]|uniref:site-specific DNA-methyltransferase (adenine-specific) n=1 Tax=Helicobacter canis NCTC 12740 TaxID=1357399 RepID=V8CEZ7_9HELI|nr:DNA methyltransferase [Helicobacter canis]ETD25677.1 hypothetical protein HMPREF2087_01505 [Helicobacter canis NCTC 12740]
MTHLYPLSQHKANPQALTQSFKALIYELFSLEVAQASAQTLHDLEQSYGEFDFGGAIVCFASTSSSETLSSSSLGHTNLAFSLICSKPSATLSKSLYTKATQAINRAISSYNIIFFLNPQEDLLTISFATRREHKRATDQDVLEKVIIIKDISLLSPSKGHLRNLASIAKASKHKKQTPTPIDTLYQESIKALSIESLNENFYKEIVGIFIKLIDSIQLPLEVDCHDSATAESRNDKNLDSSDNALSPSLRGEAEAIHTKQTDSKKTAQNVSDSAKDSRIYDEKSGLCESTQGRALGVRNRRVDEAIADLSRKAESTSDNTKREFSLRLLSRLLFCKFLEKKGVIDQAIFSTTLSDSYYHEVLEPLFFSTLNTPRDARDYALLDPRVATLLDSIPYLNGGLFAPQKSDYYSPQKPTAYHTTLKVPNAPLQELFTLLESYHFSIDESTPNSQEVGLNPELLGMVFESLLSELFTDNRKDSTSSLRKSTGSYYTPREIVQYMCRSSLYQYLLSKLDSALGEQCGSVANFVKGTDTKSANLPQNLQSSHSPTANLRILEEENRAEQQSCREQTAPTPSLRGVAEAIHNQNADSNAKVDCHADKSARNDSTAQDSSGIALSPSLRGSEATAAIHTSTQAESTRDKTAEQQSSLRGVAEAIHNLIFNRDPSHLPQTAHPQILAALSTLKVLDPACGSGAFPIGLLQELLELGEILGDTRDAYTRKLEILQSNIYGIDIQPMATEISRLRCFLSLILEEEAKDIKPLPNLEFKFLSANSLLPLPQDSTLEYDGYQADKQKLESIRQDNFSADLSKRESLKQDYLKTAAHIARNLILHAQGESPLTSWNPYDPHSVAGFFDSEYMFGLQGFDIVIGNPPYVRAQKIDNKKQLKPHYSFYQGSSDLYMYFYELGYKTLNKNGVLSYITSNKWLQADYGSPLRKLLLTQTIIEHLEVGEVFNAKVDANITTFIKKQPNENHKFSYFAPNSAIFAEQYFIKILQQQLTQELFIFDNKELVSKIKNIGISLADMTESIAKGSSTGNDDLYLVTIVNDNGDLCETSVNGKKVSIEKDLLQPFIYGENVKKFEYCRQDFYLIYPYDENHKLITHETLKQKYPHAFAYFESIKDTLLKRKIPFKNNDFYKFSALRNAKYYKTHKILLPDMLPAPRFGFDNIGLFHNAGIHTIQLKKEFLGMDMFMLGILNSKVFWFFITHTSASLSGKSYRITPNYLTGFSIPCIDSSNQHLYEQITELVRQILESKKQSKDTQELESKLDKMVYELYGLNNDEIKIIENG